MQLIERCQAVDTLHTQLAAQRLHDRGTDRRYAVHRHVGSALESGRPTGTEGQYRRVSTPIDRGQGSRDQEEKLAESRRGCTPDRPAHPSLKIGESTGHPSWSSATASPIPMDSSQIPGWPIKQQISSVPLIPKGCGRPVASHQLPPEDVRNR